MFKKFLFKLIADFLVIVLSMVLLCGILMKAINSDYSFGIRCDYQDGTYGVDFTFEPNIEGSDNLDATSNTIID